MKCLNLWVIPLAAVGVLAFAGAIRSEEKNNMAASIERKTCLAPDGVKIVYSAAGAGEPALVFIHGGLADRTFWDPSSPSSQDSRAQRGP